MTLLQVIWEPVHGQAIPDGQVEKYYDDVLEMLQDNDVSVTLSTDNILTRFRLGVAKDEIATMVIVHENQKYPVSKYGGLVNWPRGLADKSMRLSHDIIRAALDKRRNEGEASLPLTTQKVVDGLASDS